MIALLEAQRAGLFARSRWAPDLLAGLVVGVVALPLSMAFAIASGVKPEQGLYTAIVAGLVVSLFGGSRVQIAGPTGAFIVILAGIVERHGLQGLQEATFLAGVILLAMGLVGFGAVIRFIPDPVILGFTAGIGVIIAIGQLPDLLGLPIHLHGHFHQRIGQVWQALPQWHPATALVGALSLLAVLGSPRVPWLQKVPGPLVALLATTIAQALLLPVGVQTIGSQFGGIPPGLPWPRLPDWDLPRMLELIGPAFTIAMLGAIESLLSAVVADGMAGTRHDSNQELVAQGLANLLSPLCGGIAATGAIARTATNVRNGGRSPLAGIVHSIALVLIIVLLAPLAIHVPLAALAGILLVVAWNMSEVPHFIAMIRRAPRADIAILLVTFMLTVFADLVVAVNIGVILATLQFLRRMATSVEVQVQGEAQLLEEFGHRGFAGLPKGVLVYAVEGPIFFAAVEQFERALHLTDADPRVLILRLRWVPFMDVTGLVAIEDVVRRLRARGIRVLLSGANVRVAGKLERAGVTQALGAENLFTEFSDALAAAVRLADAP
jgi:SulP family sulfate permease